MTTMVSPSAATATSLPPGGHGARGPPARMRHVRHHTASGVNGCRDGSDERSVRFGARGARRRPVGWRRCRPTPTSRGSSPRTAPGPPPTPRPRRPGGPGPAAPAPRAPSPRALSVLGRRRAGRDRRGQAALALARATSTPTSTPPQVAGRLRGGRGRLRVGAHRRRVLRRVGRRPGARPGRPAGSGAAQGLHGGRGRRVRRPAHGGRRRPAHRGRPVRRRALGLAAAWPRSSALDALVEVHDEAELERALDAGADARRGEPARPDHLRGRPRPRRCGWSARIPPEVVAVAESGIRGGDDARRLADAGYQAVLVGESLVRAADRRAAVRALTGHRGRGAPVAPHEAG